MTPPLIWRLKEAGYFVHEDGRPNVIVRRSANSTPGAFDDWLAVVTCVDGAWEQVEFQCTADPGRDWMVAPMNSKGTARVAPGQWKFKVGRRSPQKGGYRCLVQAAEITVIRDADLDDVIDGDLEDTGWFGIQVHRANFDGTSTRVGKWSAGCIVVPLSDSAFQSAFMDEIVGGLEDPDEGVLVTVLEDPAVRP